MDAKTAIKNLAELKRALKPGVKLTLIGAETGAGPHKFLNTTRAIEKAQNNAIMFDNKSWLYFGTAADYKFLSAAPDCFVVDCGEGFKYYLTYRIEA